MGAKLIILCKTLHFIFLECQGKILALIYGTFFGEHVTI